MVLQNYTVSKLPLREDIESKTVLKKLSGARAALAELKGVVDRIPNTSILIDTLSLQEAKDSSAIENIITTNDELFASDATTQQFVSTAAKEVHNYAIALREGFKEVKQLGLLTNRNILNMQAQIEENTAGFRKQPGTALKNSQTGEVIYTPPQHPDEVIALMTNLESFINDEIPCDWDSLVKMAVVHHQFESIHPFYDGNGRTGRMINVLYLVKEGLLTIPVLYLSRYINQHKSDYYRLLQAVRTDNAWEEWVLFILDGVEQTSKQTIALVHAMVGLMLKYKQKMRSELPKIYSQDLINNIFRYPYTKIEFLIKELKVSRITATRYLNELVRVKLMTKQKLGRDSYYINPELYALLSNFHQPSDKA